VGNFGREEEDVGGWEGVRSLGIVVEVGRVDGLYDVTLICSVGFWQHRIVQRHGFDLRMPERSHTLSPLDCGRTKD